MTSVSLTWLFIFSSFLNLSIGIDPTCRGKRLNERCISDEDCEGPYYQCISGRCACPPDFEEFAISPNDDKTKVCRPAPNSIGATCQTKCKDPLLCKDNKCICFKGITSGSKCSIQCPAGQTPVGQGCQNLVTTVGGTKCSTDLDCAPANTFCNNGRCDCINGATRSGNGCILNCPNGRAPTQVCRKIMVNDPNAVANLDKQDTCPRGYACMTYGKPDIGHCCQLYCPYGSPDLGKSCAYGASPSEKCPDQTTHYCQLFEDHGTKNSLCCPRPCLDPAPLYINGACYPLAHWGDPCKENGQCEGGATMQCVSGRCQCLTGFLQVNETWPTCKKACGLQVQVEGTCRTRVNVGDPCLSSGMCPSNSICREGQCQCDCASALSAGTCVDPEDKLGLDKIISNLGSIFGKGTKPNGFFN